jgi:hypothetical protein
MSIAKKPYQIASLYEAELLVVLRLRFWEHRLADDKAYRQNLLEPAGLALRSSVDGIQLHPNFTLGTVYQDNGLRWRRSDSHDAREA